MTEALFQPPPSTHSQSLSMCACILCTILCLLFFFIEIVNSLGLGTVCQFTCLPSVQVSVCLEWGPGKGDTTLGPQTTRKVGGGSGSSVAFASQVSITCRVCFLGNSSLRDTLFIIHSRSHVQSELVEAACLRRVLFSFDTAQNHLTILTQARWEKRNTSHSEICQPLPLHLLTEVF